MPVYDWTYEFIPRKDGKPGKRLRCIHGGPYTPIHKCEICGLLGSTKRVQTRNDVYGWEYPFRRRFRHVTGPTRDLLCMGCWNRVRAFAWKETELNEIRLLIGRLQREITDAGQKLRTNHGGTA